MAKFKIGQIVEVIKKVEKQDNWDNTWEDTMDSMIGKTSKICEDREEFGFTLEDGYDYPSDSLKLIDNGNNIKR